VPSTASDGSRVSAPLERAVAPKSQSADGAQAVHLHVEGVEQSDSGGKHGGADRGGPGTFASSPAVVQQRLSSSPPAVQPRQSGQSAVAKPWLSGTATQGANSPSGLHQPAKLDVLPITGVATSPARTEGPAGRKPKNLAKPKKKPGPAGPEMMSRTASQQSRLSTQTPRPKTAPAKSVSPTVKGGVSAPALVSQRIGDDGESDDVSNCRMLLDRLTGWKVHRMRLYPWEEDFKRDAFKNLEGLNGSLGEMVARYLCWRRSVLQSAGLFWLIALVLKAWKLYNSVMKSYEEYGAGIVFGVKLGTYAQFFRSYMALEYGARAVVIISGFLAVFFAFVAACCWRRFKKSRPPAFISYMLGYSVPFIVYLILSHRTTVDIEGIQKQVCKDLMAGEYKDPDWVPGRLLGTMGGNSLSTDFSEKVVNELREAPSISEVLGISPQVCEKDPDLWDEAIELIIVEKGRLAAVDGSPCPAAQEARARQLLEDEGLVPEHSSNITDLKASQAEECSGQCAVCEKLDCLDFIPALTRSKNGDVSQEDVDLLAEYARYPECLPCDRTQGLWTRPDGVVSTWNCNSLCLPFWIDADDWADAGANVSAAMAWDVMRDYQDETTIIDSAMQTFGAFDWCIEPEQMKSYQFLLKVAVSKQLWQLILGIRGATTAAIVLFPAMFALISGTIRGAIVAKVVIPYSRIPALVLTCAISYTLPFLVLLVIIFKSILGDQDLLPSAICGLATLMVFLPWQDMMGYKLFGARDITNAQEHTEAEKALTVRLVLFYFFAVLFVVSGAWWMSRFKEALERLARSGLLGLEAETLREVVASQDFWQQYGTTIIATVSNFFGFAKISGVCFADNVLWAVAVVDEANVDARNEAHVGEQEVALFAELHKGLLLRQPRVETKFDVHRLNREEKARRRQMKQQVMHQAGELLAWGRGRNSILGAGHSSSGLARE